MADDKRLSALDSPWVQLGVPLAAIAAQAIAPRHAGPAARATMYGLNSLNDYRLGQARLSAISAENERKAQQEQDERDRYQKAATMWSGGDAEASGALAPEGGNTPEVMSELQGAAINNGQVIAPHASPDARINEFLPLLPPDIGYALMSEILKNDRENNTGIDYTDPNELNKITSALEPHPGMDISGMRVRGGGKLGYKREVPQLFKTETAGQGGARNESIASVDPQGLSETRVSDIGLAPEKTQNPDHMVVTEGGVKYVVYTSPQGVVNRVRVGTADEPDEKVLANFNSKMQMIAMGHPELAGELGTKVTKEEAQKYVEEQRNRPMLGVVPFDIKNLPQ